MNSPVIQALVNARLNELGKQDAAIAQEVFQRLGEPPPVKSDLPAEFVDWCRERGVHWMPARPGSVALYLLHHSGDGIDKLRSAVSAISEAHVGRGLADPTVTWPVPAAMASITRIEPPRAWPKREKQRFLELPYEVQVFWSKHEDRREKEIRRAHNEAAEARQALEQHKDKDDGKVTDAAA